jgi:hypothetical protein
MFFPRANARERTAYSKLNSCMTPLLGIKGEPKWWEVGALHWHHSLVATVAIRHVEGLITVLLHGSELGYKTTKYYQPLLLHWIQWTIIIMAVSIGGVAAWRPPLTTAISGSIPGLGITCELSLLFKVFFSGFPSYAKINTPKFQFDHGRGPQTYQLIAVTCYPRKTKLV